MKDSAAKAYSAWAEAEGLTQEEKRSRFGRQVRVTARYLPQLRKELRSGDITWFSDAGKPVGGKGEHPGALQHFIAGLSLCQMTHYAERASVWGIRLEDLEMSVVGHFVGMAGQGFDRMEYEVKITSPETPERIKELASAAAADCYVTNTLKRACMVTGRVMLNEKYLVDL